MRQMICILMTLLTWPALAIEPQELAGIWTSVRAERDGAPVADLVGHRLRFAGDRFDITDRDGRQLYAGTFRVDPTTEPEGIDFLNESGDAPGQTWQGILRIDGTSLTIIDNAPNPEAPRPSQFLAGKGSGYVMLEFRSGG